MKLLSNIKLGSDPELFLKQGDKFIPSLDLIGGSKWAPRETSKAGFFVQEDNVLVEYNIPPSSTSEEFKDNILLGMKLFEEFLPSDITVAIATSHKFTPEQLEDPRALEFGCDPDRNAWNKGKYNKRPDIPIDGLRSAGGHLHVGYTFTDEGTNNKLDPKKINREIIKWQDIYLGVPSTFMDTDRERKKLYGKAGAYRDKPYGVEYRTLSSFWLASEARIKWAFDQTMRAVEKVSNMDLVPETAVERVLAAINQSDEKAAESLMKEYDLQLA